MENKKTLKEYLAETYSEPIPTFEEWIREDTGRIRIVGFGDGKGVTDPPPDDIEFLSWDEIIEDEAFPPCAALDVAIEMDEDSSWFEDVVRFYWGSVLGVYTEVEHHIILSTLDELHGTFISLMAEQLEEYARGQNWE